MLSPCLCTCHLVCTCHYAHVTYLLSPCLCTCHLVCTCHYAHVTYLLSSCLCTIHLLVQSLPMYLPHMPLHALFSRPLLPTLQTLQWQVLWLEEIPIQSFVFQCHVDPMQRGTNSQEISTEDDTGKLVIKL